MPNMSPEQYEDDLARASERFGAGEWRLVLAPGRVNLIGEHTDYHEGFVLPAAIDRYVRILGRPRSDSVVAIHSATFDADFEFDLSSGFSAPEGWQRRAEGIIRTVLSDSSRAGMDLWMQSDIPVGGGLSSSAASMTGLGVMALALAGEPLDRDDRVWLARVAQRCEHEFAGVMCGLMDQLAVLLGEAEHALFIDCRAVETRLVALPDEWAIVVVDSGVRHELAASEYNRRQTECARALHAIQAAYPEVSALRDVTAEQLHSLGDRLDPTARARCRHVVEENARVMKTITALESGDSPAIGALFSASHQSLRDDYEVSCAELDALVEAAVNAPGCIGARMTGGGFGGCTVNLVARGQAPAFIDYVVEKGGAAGAIVVSAASGVTDAVALPPTLR